VVGRKTAEKARKRVSETNRWGGGRKAVQEAFAFGLSDWTLCTGDGYELKVFCHREKGHFGFSGREIRPLFFREALSQCGGRIKQPMFQAKGKPSFFTTQKVITVKKLRGGIEEDYGTEGKRGKKGEARPLTVKGGGDIVDDDRKKYGRNSEESVDSGSRTMPSSPRRKRGREGGHRPPLGSGRRRA